MKVLAFLRKDSLTSVSYRVAYVLGSISLVMTVFAYFYMARLVGSHSAEMARYGGDYFAFAIIGIVVMDFVSGWLHSLSNTIREAQLTGTLEALMWTPTSPGVIFVGMSAWPLVSITGLSIATLAIAKICVGIDLSHADWLAASAIGVLSFLAFTGYGMLSAAFVLVVKKGDPVTMLFSAAGYFLSGALFPVDLLPPWLQFWAALFPVTPAIEGIRMALLSGYSLPQLHQQWLALLIMAAITVPAGSLGLSAAFRYLRTQGGFTHY